MIIESTKCIFKQKIMMIESTKFIFMVQIPHDVDLHFSIYFQIKQILLKLKISSSCYFWLNWMIGVKIKFIWEITFLLAAFLVTLHWKKTNRVKLKENIINIFLFILISGAFPYISFDFCVKDEIKEGN